MNYLGQNTITGEPYVLPDPLEIKELCSSDKITTSRLDIGVCGASDPLYTLPITAPGNIGRYIQSSENRAKITLDGTTANSRFKMSNGVVGYSSTFDITFAAGVYDLEDFLTTLMIGIKSTWNARYVTCKIFITYNTGLERIEVVVTSPQGVDGPGYTLGDSLPQGWGVLGLTTSPIFSDDHPGGYTFINPPTYSTVVSPMKWVKYPLTTANNPQANKFENNEDTVQYTFEGDINIVGNMVCEDATINGTIISVDQLNVEAPIVETAVGNTLADTFNGGITTTYKNGIQQWSGIIRQPISSDWYLMNSNSKITKTTFPVGNGSLIGDKLTANGLLTGNVILQTGDYYFTNGNHNFIAGNNLSFTSPLILQSSETLLNLFDGINTPAILINATQLNTMIDLQARGKIFCYDVIDTGGAAEIVIKSQGSNVLYHTVSPIPFLGIGTFLCDESGGTRFRINSVATTSLNDFALETGQMNTNANLVIANQNIKTVSSNGSTNILHDEVGGDCLQVSQLEVSTNNNFRAGGQVQSDIGIFNSPIGLEVQTASQTVIKADSITTLIQTATNTSNISLITGQVDVSVPLNIFTNSLLGAVSGTVFRSYRPNNGPATGGGSIEMFNAFIATGSTIGSNSIPTVLFKKASQIKVKCSGVQTGLQPNISDKLTIFIKLNGTIVGNITKINLGTVPVTELGWTMEWTYILADDPSASTVGYISGEFKSNRNPDYSAPVIGIVYAGASGGIVPPQCPPVDMISTSDVLIEMEFFWASWSVSTYLNFYTSEIQVMT